MSILIKIEMPKGCWACPFAIGKLYECLFTKKTSNWGLTTRPSDCPLIEVPTPHGRLIDADALQLAIVEEGQANKRKKYIIGDIWELTGAEIREVINSQPTIQPRRGRWIKLDMHRGMADHKCSVCEQECYVPTCMGEPMYDFCPNCGADMRGEKE